MKNIKLYLQFFLTILLTLFYIHSCKKLDIKRIMAVRTDTVIVSNTTVTAKGTIIDLGQGITDYGFCWATNTKPTINDNKTSHGKASETGSFTDILINLAPKTDYYVRAYIYDGENFKYGTTKSFKSPEEFLVVSPGSLTINSGLGSNDQFNITSNVSWSISDDATWLTVNPTSGSNNETITVTAASENTSTSSRTATVTVSGIGVNSQIVNVTQQGTSFLSVSPDSLTISSSSGSNAQFDITSDVSWNVIDDAAWLTVNPTSGSNNGAITVTSTSENTSTSSRTATVTVSGTGVSAQTVTVTQQGTPFTCGISTVQDIDGNIYGTIQIGSQCWMTENMRTKKYPDNSPVTKGPSVQGAAGWDTDNAYYSCPPNSSNDGEDCAAAASLGMLYQWSAAMNGSTTPGTQGICPDGWHVPTHSEWTTLERTICNGNGGATCNTDFPDDFTTTGYLGSNGEGSDMAGNVSDQNWTAGTLTGNANFGNSGLLVGPSGYRNTSGYYNHRGYYTNLWSSTENGTNAWLRHLRYNGGTGVDRHYHNKAYGYCVRCVKDY